MIKSRFDTEQLSVKIGIFFARFGLSANVWTLLAIIPAVCGFLSLYSCHDLVKGLGFFVIAGAIDAIDGAVARVTGSASAFGAFLDGVIDRYVEFLLYIGLFFYGIDGGIIALLVFGAMMPTFVTAYSDHRKVVTEAKLHKKMGGLIERAERLILIYIGIVLHLYGVFDLSSSILIVAVLSNFTALQRIWFVYRQTK